MTSLQPLLDALLAALLGATLFHAVRLQRNLRALKSDHADLVPLLAQFSENARLAEQAIDRLQLAGNRAADALAGQERSATTLRHDLEFLAARAEPLAAQLETLIRQGRALSPAQAAFPVAAAPHPLEPGRPPPQSARPPSEAERSLILALRAGR